MQHLRSTTATLAGALAGDEKATARRGIARALGRAGLVLAALGAAGACQAFDYGPFTLHGFGKVEVGRNSNICKDCQLLPNEERQRFWADQVVPGQSYGTENSHIVLLQPYLGAHFDLPRGFKVSGLVSQRWRNGSVDLPGFWYEKNVSLSHEDYGTLTVGAFPTRAWGFADYPFGSDFGQSDTWSSTGAGYGLNTHALRYTARTLDFFDGDLVLEATYDEGNTNFKVNKPRFLEFWSRYYRGPLKLDVMVQDTRNGGPSSWGHAPFTGLTYDPAYDSKVGPSGQSVALAMLRYQITSNFEGAAGIRRNRWSGTYAVCVDYVNNQCVWNNMFNTDWGGQVTYTDNGVSRTVENPGYPAVSTDFTFGGRYVMDRLSFNASLVHLGKASTLNPVERGQSNSLLKLTFGTTYDMRNGLVLYGSLNFYDYGLSPQSSGCSVAPAQRAPGSCTLAPLSVPGNSTEGPDSRVSKTSNGITLGATYSF